MKGGSPGSFLVVVVRLIDGGGGPVGSVTPIVGTGVFGTAGTVVVRATVAATATIVTAVVDDTAVGETMVVNCASSGARSAGVDAGDTTPPAFAVDLVTIAVVVVGRVVAVGLVVAVGRVVVGGAVPFATSFLVDFLTGFFVVASAAAVPTAVAPPTTPTARASANRRDRIDRGSNLISC